MKEELNKMVKLTNEIMRETLKLGGNDLCVAFYDEESGLYSVDLDFSEISAFYAQVSFLTDGTPNDYIEQLDTLADELDYNDYVDPYGLRTNEDSHNKIKAMLGELLEQLCNADYD